MKRTINNVLVDEEVFEMLDEIKRQLSTNWIYIHANVFKMTEKCNCFERYEELKQLNKDGSCTELIKVTFKIGEDEFLSMYIENCKVGNFQYYIVHSMEIKGENITTNSDPNDVIFFRTL